MLDRDSEDGRRFRPAGDVQNLPDELASALRRERLWLLMLLHHEAGGDAVDPRLAFLASADDGLTRKAIRTRLEVAFGLTRKTAEALIEVAIEHRYLRKGTNQLYWAHGETAWSARQRETEPMLLTTT